MNIFCSHLISFYILLFAYSHTIYIKGVMVMPKNYNLRKLILEILEGEELSKKKILETIRKKSGICTSDKTFNESLMNLLHEGQIYIVDYDFAIYNGVKRIQSIRPEGIVFGVSKMDFVEIETIFKQMESNNHEEVYRASKNLKRIFRRKMEELQSKGILSNSNGADAFFDQTIFYMNSMGEKQKRSLRNKLAWSLSNNKGSLELFKNIIDYIKSQE